METGEIYLMKNLSKVALRDCHVHTSFCNHAVGTMEEYVLSAIDKGLHEIGFLAHVEEGIQSDYRTWLKKEQLDLYWQTGRELKVRYKDKIIISLGLEVGINPDKVFDLQAAIDRYPWDRIGLSYHYFLHEGKGLNICSRRPEIKAGLSQIDGTALYHSYYQTILQHLDVFHPDMVCHLNVVRRNFSDLEERAEIRALISDILHVMKGLNIALEINTSGYTFINELYPSAWIIVEAANLGIDFVFGSDSHAPANLGHDFSRAVADIHRALKYSG